MMKFLAIIGLIAIANAAPNRGYTFLEPTSVLGRLEPQPLAPASTEHGRLIPAFRNSEYYFVRNGNGNRNHEFQIQNVYINNLQNCVIMACDNERRCRVKTEQEKLNDAKKPNNNNNNNNGGNGGTTDKLICVLNQY